MKIQGNQCSGNTILVFGIPMFLILVVLMLTSCASAPPTIDKKKTSVETTKNTYSVNKKASTKYSLLDRNNGRKISTAKAAEPRDVKDLKDCNAVVLTKKARGRFLLKHMTDKKGDYRITAEMGEKCKDGGGDGCYYACDNPILLQATGGREFDAQRLYISPLGCYPDYEAGGLLRYERNTSGLTERYLVIPRQNTRYFLKDILRKVPHEECFNPTKR